jgi:hypothetical protein
MPDDERMFAQLMEDKPHEPQPAKPELPAKPERHARPDPLPADPILPADLEDLSGAGYTSHSYRLTEAELKWLRRFCLRLSEHRDQTVSHNTFVRLLLRLAQDEWDKDPKDNHLLQLLSRLKN